MLTSPCRPTWYPAPLMTSLCDLPNGGCCRLGLHLKFREKYSNAFIDWGTSKKRESKTWRYKIYTAWGDDEGSYLLIRKIDFAGQASMEAPTPMHFSGRTGFATPSTITNTFFGPSFLQRLTQCRQAMHCAVLTLKYSLSRICSRKPRQFRVRP